jgi:hypothetical protein
MFLALLWLCGITPSSETEALAPRVRVKEVAAAVAVRRAVEGARRKLRDPSCLAVLSEFKDLEGRPLDAVLATSGLAAEERPGSSSTTARACPPARRAARSR